MQTQTNGFMDKYWKLITAALLAIVAAGLIVTIVSSQASKKEKQGQDQLVSLENLYFKHLESSQPANPMNPAKNPAAEKVDVEKLKADLKSFIDSKKPLIASQIASLYLSDLLLKENKAQDALDLLQSIKTGEPHLTNMLVIKKIGLLQAQLNQCDKAVSTWDDLVKIKSAHFLKDEIRINQSLCFIEQKDWSRAEKLLMQIKSENTQLEVLFKDAKKLSEATAETQTAVRNAQQTNQQVDKILRLIQFKLEREKSGS